MIEYVRQMKIASNLPELTVEQAEHCFMSPADVLELAVGGDADRKESRQFLNNISDRQFILFRKSGTAKTNPRFYSAISAVMLRAMWEITRSGRTYEFAGPIARRAGWLTKRLIGELNDIGDIDDNDWFILYGTNLSGEPTNITEIRRIDFTPEKVAAGYDVGLLLAGSIIKNVLQGYADHWERNRQSCGMLNPSDRYYGYDDLGRPLNPADDWNQDLPPLERAKRLLEIEEYIERREAKKKQGGGDG